MYKKLMLEMLVRVLKNNGVFTTSNMIKGKMNNGCFDFQYRGYQMYGNEVVDEDGHAHIVEGEGWICSTGNVHLDDEYVF